MIPTTLFDLSFEELAQDAYYNHEFLALHAMGNQIESHHSGNFIHGSVSRNIPGSALRDLETPWGYGGPLASTADGLAVGTGKWKKDMSAKGNVAEFIRLHPCLNPVALKPYLDFLVFDRPTVMVDLSVSNEDRLAGYDRITRKRIRQGAEKQTVREATVADVSVFRSLYEIGLGHNIATGRYYFDDDYFAQLLGADWSKAWISYTKEDEPIAMMCTIHGGPMAHTHLSGGNDLSRKLHASYLLHHHAIEAYATAPSGQFKLMHLGGGRTNLPGDHLYEFKARFSPIRSNFFLGGVVLNPDAYDQLGGDKNGFFLGYRAGDNLADSPPERHPEKFHTRAAKATDYIYLHQTHCQKSTGTDWPQPTSPDWAKGQLAFAETVEQYTTLMLDQDVVGLIRSRGGIAEIVPLQGLQMARENRPVDVLAEILNNIKEIHFPVADGEPTWQKAIGKLGFTYSTEKILERHE